MRNILILLSYGVIFLTGAAGLVYQVAWQKYLSRLLGADSIATAIILATFLGGLSLGYYLCGKFSTRLKHPLRGFAVLEGAIGIWGLAFPVIFWVIDGLTKSWSFSAPFLILLQGVSCSVLLIAIPTICMGGTVPLMTRGISQNLREATSVHAAIYSINTAGAVLGALLAGFYLIPRFGLPGTVRGTALVNLGASLFFLLIAGRVKPQPADETEPIAPGKARQPSRRFPAPVLYAVALASGFYVMMLENVLIRFTNFSLGSSSYSFSLVVAVFILSIAVGSGIVARLPKIPPSLLFWNQFVIAVSLLLVYFSLDTWPYWAHLLRIGFQSNPVGFWQYYICVFLALAGVLILPVACMGATIPIAFHELKRDLHTVGRHSGLLLSWNTVGSLAGSLIGGVALYYLMNNERIFLVSVLLTGGSVCLVARYLTGTHLLAGGILTAVALGSIIFAPFFSQDRFGAGTFLYRQPLTISLSGPSAFFENFNKDTKLLFYDDDPISAVGVVEGERTPSTKAPLSIMVNGKSDSSTEVDIYTTKLLAHLPALLAKSRKEVFVIGLGTGVTAGEMSLYPDVERIDVAEISPSVIKALPLFSDFTHAVHKNPKLRLLNGDAFRVLGRSEKKWDIIISEPSNPWVTGVDLLFTREFYRMVKSHLKEGGVFIQWVQQYDSSMDMLGMIFNTVYQEFPQSRLFGSGVSDMMIVASERALNANDVRQAGELFRQSDRARESLRELDMDQIDSLLIREAWTPSYFRDRFTSFGLQTMDHPRLHYIAGRDFFNGFHMNPNALLDSYAIRFIPEYLMVMKYPDWEKHVFPPDELQILVRSLRMRDTTNINTINYMMLALQSVLLKAFLGNSNTYQFSMQDYQQMGLHVLQFVVSANQANLDWGRIGLRNASFRQKAQFLLQHIGRTRNWIVPYPLVGLEALLQQGISESKDPYERTWCALRLSLLIYERKADKRLIKNILDKVMLQNGGEMPVADEDRYLLEEVKQMIKGLS